MIEGNKRKQSRDMEPTRLICWYIAAANWDTSKRKMPSIQDFMPLPTDEKKEAMTEDKYQAIFKIYADKGHLKPINE